MRHLLVFFVFGCLAVLGFVAATNLTIYLQTKSYIYQDVASAPSAEVVVIPGAAIFTSGALSEIFQNRVDMAIALYKAGKASKILVSGDNSTVSHNEVSPVRTYLLAEGIPDADIFLDHAGFDTYSTLYRAKIIFNATSTLIASQSFHLPRAVFIGRNLGLTTYGVNADVGQPAQENYFREVLADEKAVLDLILRRVPKYLGEEIPITGAPQDNP